MIKNQNDHQHPSDDQLVAFGLGELPDELFADIELHIAQCNECCEKLQEIPHDQFVLNFRSDQTEVSKIEGASTTDDAQLPKTGAKVRYFGDYELLDEIARGGMGVVYRARQSKLNRIVALKMILGRHFASHEQVQRFQREAEAAASLNHQGIVPIYEVGEHDGLHFYSMQFVEGQSLSQIITNSPLPVVDAAIILRDCARAIEFAHQSNLVHRDLKPANILIDESGIPRITDFGLAKQTKAATELTASGQVMGTPGFMPPEQAGGKSEKIDQRSDVYSLGATLYATITGRPPFQADNSADTLVQVIEHDPVAPRMLNPKIPKDLETICLKCLEKVPAQRYQSAGELADELQRFIDGMPIRARPIGRMAKSIRWCQRNPTVTSISTLAIVFLIAGTIVSTYFAILASDRYENEKQQRKLAEDRQQEANDARQQALDAQADAFRETARTKAALFDSERNQYFNLINTALLEWQANNPKRARQILQTATRMENWKQLHHWEWDYLQNLFHPEAEVFENHSDWVMGVAMSPVENRLASCGRDHSIYIADLDSNQVTSIKAAHDGPVYSVVFSPDGKLLASCSQDKKIKLWNADEGLLVRTIGSHDGTVECITFTSDGSRLISAARDQTITIWPVDEREEPRSFKQPFAHVYRFSLSPDDRHLALIAGGSPKGGGKVLVYELATGKLVRELEGISSFASAVEYSPEGSKIVAGTYDGSIITWNAATGELIEDRKLHENYITAISFNTAGTQLASACSDIQKMGGAGSGEVVVCDQTGFGNNIIFRGHHERIRDVVFDRLGNHIATAGYDHTVRVWDTRKRKSSVPIPTDQGTTFDISINKNNSLLATAGRDVKIWDSKNNQQVFQFKGHSKWINHVAFSSDGIHVASGGRDEPVLVWDSTTGKEVDRYEGHQGEVKSVQFHPDGKRVISTDEKNVFVWNVFDGADGFSVTYSRGGSPVTYAAGDVSGKCIAVGHQNGLIKLIDEKSKAIKKLGAHRSAITSLQFSPVDKVLASTSIDGSAKLWDCETGELIHSLEGHTRPVHAIAFSPDGKRVATASRDTFVKLWDVDSGSPVLTLRGHPEGVLGIDWSNDGTQIVSVGYGNIMIVWNGATKDWVGNQQYSLDQK